MVRIRYLTSISAMMKTFRRSLGDFFSSLPQHHQFSGEFPDLQSSRACKFFIDRNANYTNISKLALELWRSMTSPVIDGAEFNFIRACADIISDVIAKGQPCPTYTSSLLDHFRPLRNRYLRSWLLTRCLTTVLAIVAAQWETLSHLGRPVSSVNSPFVCQVKKRKESDLDVQSNVNLPHTVVIHCLIIVDLHAI